MRTIFMLSLLALTFPNFNIFCQDLHDTEPFKIELKSVKMIKGYATGNSYVTPRRGFKCILTEVALTNISNEEVVLELGEFRLLDTVSRTAYLPQAIMANKFFTIGARSNKKVNPGETIVRRLYYFIKVETAVKYFAYKNEIYEK